MNKEGGRVWITRGTTNSASHNNTNNNDISSGNLADPHYHSNTIHATITAILFITTIKCRRLHNPRITSISQGTLVKEI